MAFDMNATLSLEEMAAFENWLTGTRSASKPTKAPGETSSSKAPGDPLSIHERKRSYEYTNAALAAKGLQLMMTKEEFDNIPVPTTRGGTNSYSRRKVRVSRMGQVVEAMLCNLLSWDNAVLTPEERAASQARGVAKQLLKKPKGSTACTYVGDLGIAALHTILNLPAIGIEYMSTIENRRASGMYRQLGVDVDAYVSDKSKCAKVQESGRLHFSTTISDMLIGLEAGTSFTFIGMESDGTPKRVWFLTPLDDFSALQRLAKDQGKTVFAPTLQSNVSSLRPFPVGMTAFCYDLETSDDLNRLRQAKVAFALQGRVQRPLDFWNDDPSQIPSETHRREQEAFDAVRTAVRSLGAVILRKPEDKNKTPDFWLGFPELICRVEDKMGKRRRGPNSGLQFTMRGPDRLPYSPNDFDVLQISCLEEHIVVAVPMRKWKGDKVVSHFTAEQLGGSGYLDNRSHKRVTYNLKNSDDVGRYLVACEAAARIPLVSEDPVE